MPVGTALDDDDVLSQKNNICSICESTMPVGMTLDDGEVSQRKRFVAFVSQLCTDLDPYQCCRVCAQDWDGHSAL